MAPIFSAERNLWTQTQRKNNDFCFITVNKKVVSKTNKAIESKSFLKSGDIVHCTVVSVNPYVIGAVIKTDDSRSKGFILCSQKERSAYFALSRNLTILMHRKRQAEFFALSAFAVVSVYYLRLNHLKIM